MDSGAAINQTVKPLFQSHNIFGLLARASLYYVKADDIDDDDDGLCEHSIEHAHTLLKL